MREIRIHPNKRRRKEKRRPNALIATRDGIQKIIHEENHKHTMAQLLEKNNIPVPDSARKKYGNSSSSEGKEKCHELVEATSNSSSFIIDSSDSKHMVSNI